MLLHMPELTLSPGQGSMNSATDGTEMNWVPLSEVSRAGTPNL
jgi:hypothetical protein